MHSVNLDLLRTASTRHGEEHAHHRAAHLEALNENRQLARAAWLGRLAARLSRFVAAARRRQTRTDGF